MRTWTPLFAMIVGLLISVGGGGCSSHSSGGSASGGSASDSGVSSYASMSYDGGMSAVGQLDGGIETKLPPLPPLTNVVATQNDDSASIVFDPVDGALDYRVYALPNNADINVASDGHIAVRNAIYRCAGNRESAAPYSDNSPMPPSDSIHTQVDKQMVGGFLRTLANASLGYVFTQPGPGLVPLYALGDADPNADSTCFFARWSASRVKKFTTSETERVQLLGALARDDGIIFYVPASASAATKQIYWDEDQVGTQYTSRYYFPEGPEADVHPNKRPAFLALTNAASGALPLKRVFYGNSCGWSHDELMAGDERFNRAYKQGDGLPWWSLLWTGITGPVTLVVEALDSGCPWQGLLSARSIAGVTGHYGAMDIPHAPYVTIDDVRAMSTTTEVFINGQHDSTSLPKAIARSFVRVQPNPHPTMDFFADFSPSAPAETFTEIPCGAPDGNCFQTWRQQSPTFDQIFMNVESGPTAGTGLFAAGPVMGELWLDYADFASDTNGKFRLTAKQKANMDSSAFLHVTMEVDAYSTARRYPQILISDQDVPVQYNMDKGHTIVVQPIGEVGATVYWPIDYQIELCSLRVWDVNNQCPAYDLYHQKDVRGNVVHLAPNDEFGEHASADHRVAFDVFASTGRVFLYLDGKPYACANLPPRVGPSGPVTVTWGDVLYHSAVDLTFAFHHAHMQVDMRRHFDNLGFSSGVPAPIWDESRLPCAPPITL